MKYAVAKVSNGNFTIDSEWTDKNSAIVRFHSVCSSLWNAQDIEHACVVVVDEKMNIHKIDYIKYDN